MTYAMSLRRKVAIATWSPAREGNIYGKMQIDTTLALKYLKQISDKYKSNITITHFIGKVIGTILADFPELNGRICLGKFKPEDTVDISFLVQIRDGKDLGKVKVSNIDKRSLYDISRALKVEAKELRSGTHKEHNKSLKIIKHLPTWIIRPLLNTMGYFTCVLNSSVPSLGLERKPFGVCLITSLGMLGLEEAFVPPTPFARVPFYIMIPAIKQEATVVDGKIEVRPILKLTATLDHRYIDGFAGAQVVNRIHHYFSHPEELDS